jgi:excinuclease ABC subunit C
MKSSEKTRNLPQKPGVYVFKDAKGAILYIGKAKVLRKRVQSYFRVKNSLDRSKQKMVELVADIETIVCDSESEALILEANLIHEHQPPYNIVLRDDKYYLFIKITTNEDRPRVFPVRKLKNDKARYFGPYSSATSVRQTLRLLRRIFPYQGEKKGFREKIFPHPLFDRELKSSLKRSVGAKKLKKKTGSLKRRDYESNIASIIGFLQGNRQKIINTLSDGMKKAAKKEQYERATIFRDQLNALKRLEGWQKVYLPRKESFDVVSVAKRKRVSAANVFSVRHGKLLAKNTFLIRHRMFSNPTNILCQFLLQYYKVAQDIPRLIYIPEKLENEKAITKWINTKKPPVFKTPQRGKKRSLLEMGKLNAEHLLDQESASFIDETMVHKSLIGLANVLNIKPRRKTKRPTLARIETYDISNIQGKLATGSMIVFKNGKPNKKQYKKFRIKLTDSPDDYAMLREVLSRRFAKHNKGWPKPNLILIDGGRGQLSAAKHVLDKYKLKIPIASIAKREEVLLTYSESTIEEIRLPYDSPTLFLIQRMRDEAHRFTISYHQLLRSKHQQRSLLDEIPGVGPTTKKKLLRYFGSLKAIRSASTKDLIKVIGKSKTEELKDWL